jgi:hypothetical protein
MREENTQVRSRSKPSSWNRFLFCDTAARSMRAMIHLELIQYVVVEKVQKSVEGRNPNETGVEWA